VGGLVGGWGAGGSALVTVFVTTLVFFSTEKQGNFQSQQTAKHDVSFLKVLTF
jgi:hypothetical protein